MFGFNEETPTYRNPFFRLADAISGSVFAIAGLYAYSFNLYAIGIILAAVSVTSITHIFIPWRSIRLLDYALAVTLVLVCLLLVFQSNFYYPYSLWAAITCSISFVCYGIYQKRKYHSVYAMSYYFWHIGALSTCILSITAFTQSL